MRNFISRITFIILLLVISLSVSFSSGWMAVTVPGAPLPGGPNAPEGEESRTLSHSDIMAGGGGNEGVFEVSVTSTGISIEDCYFYWVYKNQTQLYFGYKTDSGSPVSLTVSGQEGDTITIRIMLGRTTSTDGQSNVTYGAGTISFGP
jgi:hypothetical protein